MSSITAPITLLTISLVALYSSDVGAAQITPVAQQRSVSADSIVSPVSQQDFEEVSAPNFGPFDAGVSTKISNANATASNSASQRSTIDSCAVSGLGQTSAFGQSGHPDFHGYANGFSTCRVVFDLDQTAEFLIAGNLQATDFSQTQVMLQSFPTPLLFSRQVQDGSLQVHHRVTLNPGRYIITFQSHAGAAVQNAQMTQSSDYDMKFTMCFNPADINVDGAVNVNDLLGVINAWGACPAEPQPCAADINLDGAVNVNDLLAVINAWGR